MKNHDMLLQTFTASMAGAVGFLSRFAVFGGARDERGRTAVNPLVVMLAPVAAMLIQFAISRQREFAADRVGAELSGKPLAHVNPLAAYGSGLARLFATHPSTAERVARLEAMAHGSVA